VLVLALKKVHGVLTTAILASQSPVRWIPLVLGLQVLAIRIHRRQTLDQVLTGK
jgi:hypothetical protein